jgi:nitroimidazol reductase NimA-like FMN-containing flavoprotein (pyridoxamine 5'-phosphate oxidase superfamily)/GNAT superfamily N-acetyltransferase
MRRIKRKTDDARAWQLLKEARWVHLASTTPEGQPVLRVLNTAVHDGWLLFHGAQAGEKSLCLGREAVVSAHEVVASIPSYFIDEEMACPATTYYRSAQAHGVLRNVDELSRKAVLLQAFMQHQQAEGGHQPIDTADPRYEKELRAVRVFGLDIARVAGKENLGQDRPPERTRKVVDGLWRRGDPSDPEAIRIILERSPRATPDWLKPPQALADQGVRLVTFPTEHELEQTPRLLLGRYWKENATPESIRLSHARSSAWVGALAREGTLIGMARALGDAAARGVLYDVVVDEPFQKLGLGRSLVQLLLNHPAVRGCERLLLATRDRMRFYEHFGFQNLTDNEMMMRTM